MKTQSSKSIVTSSGLSRRQFLRRTGMAAGATAFAFPFVGRVLGANSRINIACIGVGGKGDSDSSNAAECGGNIIAICDVDQTALDKKSKQLGDKSMNPRQFKDYRKMLDTIGKDVDAVTVSTPDHHHGIAAIRAMTMGKHCFCQKPLCQTISEVRAVRQLAREKNLATQMGNQGSAEPGLQAWLAAGFNGSMHYMARHGMTRARPAELVNGTLRVLSARMDYLPRTGSSAGPPAEAVDGDWQAIEWQRLRSPGQATVSIYARGRDYHKVLRQRLQALADRIAQAVGPFGHRVFTDSAPVLEVELATRSGIGWRGKHTLTLHRLDVLSGRDLPRLAAAHHRRT